MIQIATPFLGIQFTIQLFSHSLSVWHGEDGVMGREAVGGKEPQGEEQETG
jgi:hypothetical protein